MKIRSVRFGVVFIFLVGGLLVPISAQNAASIDLWREVAQTEEIVSFFDNLFVSIGIVISDTGEEFTCVHLGDRIEFEEGIASESVDYIIEIERFQVERLASYAHLGDIAPEEQYRVMREVFTPATAALLAHPAMNTPLVRWMSGAERVIHVKLDSPVETEDDLAHTLRYVDKSWQVVPGLVDEPERIYHLTLEHAIEFQKVAYAIGTKRNPIARIRFSIWYRRWRKDVSEKL